MVNLFGRDAFDAQRLAESEMKAKNDDLSLSITRGVDFSLPPGISDVNALTEEVRKDSSTSGEKGINESRNENNGGAKDTSTTTGSAVEKRRLPPKPPGPPPAWAFKHKQPANI